MRASELLRCEVVDASGNRLGPVRDIRVTREGFRVAGLVIGRGPCAGLAHAWGYAEGRSRGPALLSALCRRAVRNARFVPADRVLEWGPGVVRIEGDARDLPPLQDGVER